MSNLLRQLYYDVSSPAAFSSVDRLYRHAREIDSTISRQDVERFLSGEIAYTLHRRVIRKIKRNPVIAHHYGDMAQADLVDVHRYSEQNDGVNYILTVIDVFSKKAFAITILRKSAANVARAFRQVFTKYQPSNLQTDKGLEFKNSRVSDVMKSMLINHYFAHNERIKCSVVERFQRTLMSKIHKYFTARGTTRFVDVLQDFVQAYNNAYHRTIKMTPNEASEADTQIVFRNNYGYDSVRDILISSRRNRNRTIRVGSHVRVPEQKTIFEKGYQQNFTDAIYKITNVNTSTKRPLYQLQSSTSKQVKGSFYPEEVQRVSNSDKYRVIVLDERRRGRGKQVLIRYANFPDCPPEWISGSRLLDIA